MFVRTKTINGKNYYYLVESKREGQRTYQKVIKYLGKTPPTPEELDRIIKKHEKQKK